MVPHSSRSRFASLLKLLGAGGGAAIVWLGILPAATRFPTPARHIEIMEEGGVNPGAMFYTELETLPQGSIPLNQIPTDFRRDESPH